MIEFVNVNIVDYYDVEMFNCIKIFVDGKEMLFVVIDIVIIYCQYDELVEGFFYVKVYYVVKVNLVQLILFMLWDKGVSFDIVLVYELEKVLVLGVFGDCISYGNIIKKV